ncbi:histone deacetylase [Synechococcus sp. Nb3U1]|uniref:histone deacetylase family protein n=1 Tax=Synechococcus sp. Nb3U1 TaxID=1914529 RepID=UPI001F2F8D3F|nr:histone deacetylase [Synechococcus sp. Nb3U1]MCF2971392.1 histone deacetylase [Synechococcus sp. Nb3U1]
MLPIYYSDVFLSHDTGAFHPERPARLLSIVKTLRSAPFANKLEWRDPPVASLAEIERVHSPQHIQSVAALAAAGGGRIEADTLVSSGSFEAARLAVGAWIAASERVLQTSQPAFVLCRPPGHHAEPEQAMGFCLFSNAAIAALWALEQPGIERVAIFDWDVHHGNGTQAVVEHYPQLAYASTHQFPLYPGTGSASEIGIHGNICNVPLPAGSDWSVYKSALSEKILPFLQKFQPDLLLISAGFDCAKGDPLAGMLLEPEDFGRMAQLCLEQVTRKTLFGLEGGYDLNNLARSWLSLAQVCLEGEP